MSATLVKELRERTGLGLLECKKALAVAGGDIEVAIEELRKSSGMKAAKKASRTAADGVVAIRIAADSKSGVIGEVNSETDFVARDENFAGFVAQVMDKAVELQTDDVVAVAGGDIEDARQALVQKIGENISVRRLGVFSAAAEGVVGGYVHGNNRIAVLVELAGGDEELVKDVAMHIAAVNPAVVSPAEMPEELLQKEREIYAAQAADTGKPPEIVEKMIEGRIRKYLSENSLTEQAFVKDPDTTIGKLVEAAGATIVGFTRFEVGEGIEVEKVDFASEVAAQLGN